MTAQLLVDVSDNYNLQDDSVIVQIITVDHIRVQVGMIKK